jgi:adenylate cyclase
MSNSITKENSVIRNFLISFIDITHYIAIAQRLDTAKLFSFVEEFALLVGAVIEAAGGTVIKFIGDAALIIFPEGKVNEGVQALLVLKEKTDRWLKEQGFPSQLTVKAHWGEAAFGLIGTGTDNRPDVIGHNVNIAAAVPAQGMALSPQVFRKLSPAMRKLFKKHTPPVTYIGINDRHSDK